MNEFHQHPDGHVIVRGASATYTDSRENFIADFGVEPPAMPEGADDHIYTQGKRHAFMGDGNVIAGGPVPWPEGDEIIANVEVGLAAQAVRNPPPVEPPPDPSEEELLRIATFAEDPDLMPGLEEIKVQTAAGIDSHVDGLIVLGEGSVERLRSETQQWLRYIYRRQLKMLFNPDPLTAQLNRASIEAKKIRERSGK